jgi:hypothetical protein
MSGASVILWTGDLQGCLNPPGKAPDWRPSPDAVAVRPIASYLDRMGLGDQQVLLVVGDDDVAIFDETASRSLESLFVYDGGIGGRDLLASTWFNDSNAKSRVETGAGKGNGITLIGGAMVDLAQALRATSKGGAVTSLGRLLLWEILYLRPARRAKGPWGRIILGRQTTLVVAADPAGKQLVHRVIPVGADHFAISLGNGANAAPFRAWDAKDTSGWLTLPMGVKDAYPAFALLAQGILLALDGLLSTGQQAKLTGHAVEEKLACLWKPLRTWIASTPYGSGCSIAPSSWEDLKRDLAPLPKRIMVLKDEAACSRLALRGFVWKEAPKKDNPPATDMWAGADEAEDSGKTVIEAANPAPSLTPVSPRLRVGHRAIKDDRGAVKVPALQGVDLSEWWYKLSDKWQRRENGRVWRTDVIGWLAGGLAGIAIGVVLQGAYFTLWSKLPDANASYPAKFEAYAKAVRGQVATGQDALPAGGPWTRRLRAMATALHDRPAGSDWESSRLWLRALRVESRSLSGMGRASVMTVEGRALRAAMPGAAGGTGAAVLLVNRFIESLSGMADFMASVSSIRLVSVKDSPERPGMLDFTLEIVFTPAAAK